MMKKINRFLKKSFEKKIDGTGLAIFRIAYCIVLLCEIGQMFYFRHLIFDKVPYIELSEIEFGVPIAIWFVSVLFILFGAFTKLASVINYLMSLILIGTISSYEYHVFYAYMGVNFLFMFMPVSQCLSVDRLLKRLKYSNTTFLYDPTKNISQLYYFLPLFLAIGLIYFDSFFIKTTAQSWQMGLGMWMPSSFPMMTHLNTSFLLNQKWLMIFLGYLVLIFEFTFIFLFTFKKMRWPFFIIGVGLHIGILIVFPIPWFALTYCTLYLLLVPVSFWRFFRKENELRKLYVYYDTECPLCLRTKITVSFLDIQKKIDFRTVQFESKNEEALRGLSVDVLLNDIHSVDTKGTVYSGVDTYIGIFSCIWYLVPFSWFLRLPGINYLANRIYTFIAVNRTSERCTEDSCGISRPVIVEDSELKILRNYSLHDLKFVAIKTMLMVFVFFQFVIIANSPLVTVARKAIGFESEKIDAALNIVSSKMRFSKVLFGITAHGVFIDKRHYLGYNHIVAVTYVTDSSEVWLPIIDKNGQPGWYNYGTNWRKISFSTNSPLINEAVMRKGIRDFTAFWANKNNIELNNARFNLKIKKISAPSGWERDFLNKLIAKPWIDGGHIIWEGKEMTSFIKDIESL